MRRREYALSIELNLRQIKKVIIDPHYEDKHAETISDELILELVKTLDGESFEPEEEDAPFLYFTKDKIEHGGKLYRLVWLLETNEIYIGIVNAYRR